MSKAVKIKIYKTIIQSFVVFEGGTWAKTEVDMTRLGAWERKILRSIYGPVVEHGTWRIRTNQELRGAI
jgi:hypothetical protein